MNPWMSMSGDPAQALSTGYSAMGQDAQMAVNAQQYAPYPSFPNAAGAGSQSVGVMPTQSTAAPPAQMSGTASGVLTPTNNSQPNQTSQGFNPWSLQGEALSRGR